jgi:hypothetical protein
MRLLEAGGKEVVKLEGDGTGKIHLLSSESFADCFLHQRDFKLPHDLRFLIFGQ